MFSFDLYHLHITSSLETLYHNCNRKTRHIIYHIEKRTKKIGKKFADCKFRQLAYT